ncbi:MAG: DUF2799 domain-containing protein [Stappiaceae bacterium]
MRLGWLQRTTLVLIFPLLLSACVTLNESECETANWRDLGQRNGQSGRAASYVVEHEKACAKYGIPVDSASWRAGWEVGIRQYCTPQNGLRVGRNGSSYAQSCPADVAPGFERAYKVGKRVHSAKRDRDAITREIDRLNSSIGAAADEKERLEIQTSLIVKQSELRSAEDRLRDAERDADQIRYSFAAD